MSEVAVLDDGFNIGKRIKVSCDFDYEHFLFSLRSRFPVGFANAPAFKN